MSLRTSADYRQLNSFLREHILTNMRQVLGDEPNIQLLKRVILQKSKTRNAPWFSEFIVEVNLAQNTILTEYDGEMSDRSIYDCSNEHLIQIMELIEAGGYVTLEPHLR